MAAIIPKSTGQISTDVNGKKKSSTSVTQATDKSMTIKHQHRHDQEELASPSNADPIMACETLRQQNDALRQELHDIRREMDEITDQFRTEDAEEFKQIQAELEVAAKNCRILQFKLRKAEKRNENMEVEKASLEEKLQQIVRDSHRVRNLDEELLVAKEVSVRLHAELEKTDESRKITEKLNFALKQQLDALKESWDQKLTEETHDDYHAWQLSVALYESLFREYILIEELTWLNAHNQLKTNLSATAKSQQHGDDVSDLMDSYQQKLALLHDEISALKQDLADRDKELYQVRLQYKILKQRSRSADRNSNSSEDSSNGQRSRRGISVDGGGNLREQLDASNDEIRLLKNKLLRLEDELNNSLLEKESLAAKVDEQTVDPAFHDDLRSFAHQIEHLNTLIRENRSEQKVVSDLQQLIRSSRWSKELNGEQLQARSTVDKSNDQTSIIVQRATDLFTLLEKKHQVLDKIRSRLTDLSYDTGDACGLLEELETSKQQFEDKQQMCERLQKTLEKVQSSSKELQEQFQSQLQKNQNLERTLEQQRSINNELQQDNTRLSTLNAKQLQDLKHLDQLRQSILTFEKKLDQKQTRVNELSMKIIEKEDIIETKVKECQKHRLELRELETKYYTLGKQLEEQIIGMSKEMEKLNIEKEMLRRDLESIRLTQQHVSLGSLSDRPSSTKPSAEDEISRIKMECRQQIVDGELESYKLRLGQSTAEKEDLLKTIKELERKLKDLQIKHDGDEQSWSRLKSDMSDKQRKYDDSVKLKSELQNAVDRLRQKLYDLEVHSQEKQNRYTVDKQQWEVQRLELTGKINELDEQLSKVTKRQRKDLETAWKKERQDLQKQLQQSQQTMKDLQKQISHRDAPNHLTEKINVLMTENELLLSKIKELEHVVDDVQLLRTEMHRLRDKNSSDWNYWRKQQSDVYAQLRQQQSVKETILTQFDRLQKQIKSGDGQDRFLRDLSVGPVSQNSFLLDTKTSLSNVSRETLPDDLELAHGNDTEKEKEKMFDKTYSAQENTAASIEEIATKIDRVEDNLFSYRRFMDFIRAKSEKSSSVARDDSFTNIAHHATLSNNNKRLASAPPENSLTNSQRRSRYDHTANGSHEHLSSSTEDHLKSDAVAHPALPSTNTAKHRFFSLSRRFRFRTQSPETNPSSAAAAAATVHFLDEDIDLETKEPTARKSDRHKPSKGILKTLRHRSPFRFRSKDAVIIEQEPSPPPSAPKESKPKNPPPPATPASVTPTKLRGRLVELKKAPSKTTPSNGAARKLVNVTPIPDSNSASSVRRASGLKDLIHKFEATPPKPKRTAVNGSSSTELDQEEPGQLDLPVEDQPQQRTPSMPLSLSTKSKTIDIPDLLQNVDKDPTTTLNRPVLRHSNSSRQTASFDSSISMVSASESVTTNSSSTRKPTSTARPLMLSVSKEESPS